MGRTTPQDTFAEARTAITHGDWEGFFATLDRDDLTKIAANGINGLVNQGAAGARVLVELGAAPELVAELMGDVERILASASTLPPSPDHRTLVRRYQETLKRLIKGTPDLGRWCAALERALRAEGAGGSVATTLFVGETLEALEIDQNRAWGIRRLRDGETLDLGFVRRREGWFIRLLARRPRTAG